MNNKTKNLIAFAFTAFVFVFASHAYAAVTSDDYGTPNYYNNYMYQNNYNNQTYGSQYQQPYVQTYGQQNYQPQSTYTPPVNNSVNNTSNNTTKTTTTNRVVARNTSVRSTPASQNQVAGANVGVVNPSDVNQVQADNLTALSMRGTNTFMPDTVFEWLLTIIFILVIIIIIRLMSKKHGHGDHH